MKTQSENSITKNFLVDSVNTLVDAVFHNVCGDPEDTTHIQLASLSLFLEELSYEITESDGYTLQIVNIDPLNGNAKYLSLKTAVALFNGDLYTKGYESYYFEGDTIVVYADEIEKAENTKLIERIYLRRSRKAPMVKGIEASKHKLLFRKESEF